MFVSWIDVYWVWLVCDVFMKGFFYDMLICYCVEFV